MHQKIRSTLVAIMFSGYAIGGMTSALLGAWLVKDMGWQIMFLIAGIPLYYSHSFGNFCQSLSPF